MAWANSSNVSTTNLDAGTDSPAAARGDIKLAMDELVKVIDGRNTAEGVCPLDAGSKVPAANLPDEFNTTATVNLTLDPSTGKVKLEEILNLAPQTVAQLNARTDIEQGDVAFCSDGDAGTECLAVAVGEDDSAGAPTWKVVSIGAAISAT
jgi:hypothetical protein